VCANKSPGVRAALIHDHFSARQGVEDDYMNLLCMGGRTVEPAVAWDFVQTFLAAEFSHADRHLRRLGAMSDHTLDQWSLNTLRTLVRAAISSR
jgi:ribose 5-phosphate isomerase B